MAKIDFERTPDGSQRIVDNNLKVGKALFLPDYTGGSLGINGNPNEAGAIAYKDAAVWSYDGSTWSMLGLPSGGTSPKYLRGDGTWQTLDTAAVPENTNLYYTASRFNTSFAAKSTTDLAEGTNLYYTAARFNTAFAGKNTDALTEGSTNIYYANSRVQTFSDTRYVQLTAANVANGYAQLDGAGLLPLSLIPDTLLGNVKYKGTYNGTVVSSPDAALNGNALPSASSANQGYYFIVTAPFTLSSVNYVVGDWIISDGAAGWTRVENSDAVTTVFGRNGNVVANTGDYTAAQVTNAVDTTATYANPAWITSLAQTKITYAGTTAQYVRGNGSLATFPTTVSTFTNDSGYLTANQSITLSGDVSGSGTTAITTAIGAGKVTNAMLAGSISNGNLANSTISGIALGSNLANLTATNASLTFSGAYNGGSAQSVGLNVANANNWTAVQNFGPTVTASAGLGVAMNITPSLNASANSDVLSSIYINSTFSAGAFTGVVQAPLKIHWSTTGVTFTDFCISNVVGDGVVTLHAAAIPTTNNYFFRCQGVDTILNAPNAAGTILLRVNNATYMQMYSTGRVGFQNGGTYTDDLIHRVQIQGGISIGGVAITAAAWGTNGVNMVSNAATYTDNSSATGTVAFNAVNSFAQPTLASTNTSVVYSQAATLYIAGGPIAGTNVTLSTAYPIFVAAGLSSFGGGITTNGNTTSSNLYVNSAGGISISSTSTPLLFAGASTVSARGVFNGQGSSTLTANTAYGGTIFASQPLTAAGTGTHGFLANVVVNAVGTVTNTSAIPITNTASLYVGPASAAGTNNYSIYNVGVHGMAGTTSGVVSITPQAASGTYNYNLPTTAGVAGQVQASGGGGSNPMTWVSLLSKPHTIFTPTTGGTVTLINNQYNIINPAGALLALTVTLPSSPANNDCVFVKFTQNVTTVTYSGGTVVDGITAPTAGGLIVLVYDSGTTSWY